MQEIFGEIVSKYELDIKSAVPYKDFFILSTPSGKKILKKTQLLPERILFIHGAKEHLFRNGFENIDRYICTADGNPYLIGENATFVLLDHLEGNECNFDDRREIARASRLLASMHKASEGYIPPAGSKPRDELGKLPLYFNRRLDEIKKLKKVAKRGKGKFDYMFLEYIDYFYNLGESAAGLILNSKYNQLVEQVRKTGTFCHHDFTHHNILCTDDKLTLVNFDFCCFELKVYDIANFIRRKMRKCNWDINEAIIIIKEYRSMNNISEDEFLILKIILQFPQKLWRVVNKYYNSNHSWAERSYVLKLQEVIEEIPYHKSFMDKFELLV